MKFKPINNISGLHKKLNHSLQLFKVGKKNNSRLCEHDKRKDSCKECNPKGFCEHNKRKYDCKDCKATSFCKHGSRKYRCKKCNEIEILCEHFNPEDKCIECISIKSLIDLSEH